MESITDLLAHPIAKGIITGIVTGIAGDVAAFRAWKTWQDAAVYDYATLSFRAVQGAIVGLITAAGLWVVL